MYSISEEDVDFIMVGAAILGSGGGGDPYYKSLALKNLLRRRCSVSLIQLEDLEENDLILPIANVGAPLVGTEKLPNFDEFVQLLEAVTNYFGKPPKALLCGEIGGGNALTPLIAGAVCGIPVLDGDTIGRAFPEIQMSTCSLFQIPTAPVFIASDSRAVSIVEAKSNAEAEKQTRHLIQQLGSRASCALYGMTGLQAQQAVIRGSLSLAKSIGQVVRQSKNPISDLCDLTKGHCVARGRISDVQQTVDGGFLRGFFCMEDEEGEIVVKFQNENLVAQRGENILVSTPDLIIPVDLEEGTAIPCDQLQYGLRVALLALPSPSIWTTKQGLELVGPEAFDYSHTYHPITQRLSCQSIL